MAIVVEAFPSCGAFCLRKIQVGSCLHTSVSKKHLRYSERSATMLRCKLHAAALTRLQGGPTSFPSRDRTAAHMSLVSVLQRSATQPRRARDSVYNYTDRFQFGVTPRMEDQMEKLKVTETVFCIGVWVCRVQRQKKHFLIVRAVLKPCVKSMETPSMSRPDLCHLLLISFYHLRNFLALSADRPRIHP